MMNGMCNGEMRISHGDDGLKLVIIVILLAVTAVEVVRGREKSC
jgi:hypothetical protein